MQSCRGMGRRRLPGLRSHISSGVVMAAVGLFYVGAVLFVNGLMLLGKVDPRAAGFLNLFVGVLQRLTQSSWNLRWRSPA